MCEQRERVLEYLYEELPAERRPQVEQHLGACEECRDELRAFRSVRQDLLAWAVPNHAPVWTPFAAMPVVPWYRQVPAWAMAAAASVMFLAGAAGVFAASAVTGTGSATGATPTIATAMPVSVAPGLDAQAVAALVRRELTSAGVGVERVKASTVAGPVTPVTLDAATEQRLMARASQLVGASEERQLTLVRQFFFEVADEANRQRRDDGKAMSALRLQVDQLQAVLSQLSQLVMQQTKVQ